MEFLTSRGIKFKPRPTRRHNETGGVERKINILRTVVKTVDCEVTVTPSEQLLSRDCFVLIFTFSFTYIKTI